MAASSDLRGQLVEQRLVRVRIDLAADHPLGTGHGQRTELAAQLLAGAVGGRLDLRLRRGLLPGGLGQRVVAGLVDDLVGAGMCLLDDLVGLGARLAEDLVAALLRLREFLLAQVGRGEALGDLALPLLDRVHQRRPDELHGEPDEQREADHLHEECVVQVHVELRRSGARPRGAGARSSARGGRRRPPMRCRGGRQAPAAVRTASSSGLAIAKNMAMASAMMNAASIRPTSRNMRACSIGTSSGWRAADSRNLEPITPMPMQAPSAPRPIIRPAAMAVKLWTLARNSIMVVSPGKTGG